MKRNLVPLLGIAFVVALVATGIFYGLFVHKLKDATDESARQTIVVAARNLDRGTVLKATDVRLSRWAGSEPLKDAYVSAEKIAGETVLTPIQENEPVTQTKLASTTAAGGIGIPSGMRAVSVHVSDSSGVMSLLRTGHRVDVQVVAATSQAQPALRTILQNIEVLGIHQPEQGGGRSAQPVVSLLVTPQDADRVGLADSTARIRLALRNPLDKEAGNRRSLLLASLITDAGGPAPVLQQASSPAPSANPAPVVTKPVAAVAPPPKVQLSIRVVGADPKALEELSAQMPEPRQVGMLQVRSFDAAGETSKAVRGLEEKRRMEVFASSSLTAQHLREVSMQTGERWTRGGGYGLRILFVPSIAGQGKLKLRLQPEVSARLTSGATSRKFDTEVELTDGQSLLLSGLAEAEASPSLVEKLFGGKLTQAANRELLVLVTAQLVKPLETAAISQGQ